MRSPLDPVPQPPSATLAILLVAALVLGTGVAVVRYLEAAPGAALRAGAVYAAERGANGSASQPARAGFVPVHPATGLRGGTRGGASQRPPAAWTAQPSASSEGCRPIQARPSACEPAAPSVWIPETN
jgi:hypothetical protein